MNNIYGGDGKQTFALPDLRGRFAIGAGAGPGLSNRQEGSRGGQESVNLFTDNLPAHTHPANYTSGITVQSAISGAANSNSPSEGYFPGQVNDVNGDPIKLYSNQGGVVPRSVEVNVSVSA